jgi:transposase InsO family protein
MKLSETLTEVQKDELWRVFQQRLRVFQKPSKLGITPVKHGIPTTDDIAKKIRQYPLSHAEHEEIDRQVKEMEKQGVIEESTSAWNSPVILVKKKDGSLRFCVDFRALNDKTIIDAYPLPRIDNYLDVLGKARFFSTIDLITGYWQILLDEQDKAKTAFSTRNRHLQFKVMPFGLAGAPATFQRAMDILLTGISWQYCLVYLDDILIYSETFEEHIQHIDEVLKRLDEANFKVKPEKCQWGQNSVKFLGHIVSQNGLSMDPEKIEAIKRAEEPKNTTELQRFLGLANYYRKFVPEYAKVARPLHEIQSNKSAFNWTENCQKVFDQLKTLLSQEPLMAFPDFKKKFILETDASNFAIGAVLSQEYEEGRRVIAYFSKTMTKHQINYSVTEKECLAVVKAVKHFRQYLYQHEFDIYTDHQCLTWLKSMREPMGRLARWILELAEFKFNVYYHSGKTNVAADALLREPVVQQVMTIFDNFNIATEQRSDNHLKPLIDYLVDGTKPKDEFERARIAAAADHFVLDDNGTLIRVEQSKKGAAFQVVIPWQLRGIVLRSCHSDITSGHFGFQRTLDLVRERYYWETMTTDTKKFVRACIACQLSKKSRRKKNGLLKSITATEPWEIIGIDFIGPIRESKKGNRYILVITDYFTKWPEAYALREASTKEAAKILVTKIFPRHGLPKKILSDQGSQFTSNLFSELLEEMKIKKMQTTAYHPQCDGQVERLNSVLKTQITIFCDQRQFDWDEWLPLVLLAYRRTKHSVTGYSPYFMLHGRELRIKLQA